MDFRLRSNCLTQGNLAICELIQYFPESLLKSPFIKIIL